MLGVFFCNRRARMTVTSSTRSAHLSLSEKCLGHARLRAAGFFVPVVEAGLPVPDGPADPGPFGGLAKGLVVMCARGVVGRGETTELTDVDWPAVVFRPFAGLFNGRRKSPPAARITGPGLGVVCLQPISDGRTELEPGPGASGRAAGRGRVFPSVSNRCRSTWHPGG